MVLLIILFFYYHHSRKKWLHYSIVDSTEFCDCRTNDLNWLKLSNYNKIKNFKHEDSECLSKLKDVSVYEYHGIKNNKDINGTKTDNLSTENRLSILQENYKIIKSPSLLGFFCS